MLAALSVGPVRGERVQKVSEGSLRRAKQLSVIFSQYITSMMNSGEVCPELVDLNFEIQRVCFTQIFTFRVYLFHFRNKGLDNLKQQRCASLRSRLTDFKYKGNYRTNKPGGAITQLWPCTGNRQHLGTLLLAFIHLSSIC